VERIKGCWWVYFALALYGAFGIYAYHVLDLPTARYFHGLLGGDFEWWMDGLTEFGKADWMIIGALVLWVGMRRYRPRLSLYGKYILASIVASGVVINLLKWIIGRARPKMLFEDGSFGFYGWHFSVHEFNSFPSGHTTTGFAFGIGIALLFPRFALLGIGFALMIAFTRVALTAHYISDTMAGALIGGVFAWYLHEKMIVNAKG